MSIALSVSDANTPSANDLKLMPSEVNQKQLFWKFQSIGFALLAVYGAFCLFYNTSDWADPRWNREVFTWIGVLALGWLYWKGFKLLQQLNIQAVSQQAKSQLTFWLVGFSLGFAILSVLTPNFHSTDLFGYINRGWQQWHYQTNPYVTVINQLPGWMNDPVLTNHWVKNPSPYGFLYIAIAKYLCALGSWLGPNSRTSIAFVFKSLNLLLFMATGLLIFHSLKYQSLKHGNLEQSVQNEGVSPKEQAAISGLYLFLWNPLLMVHTLMNGHNDILMGAGMALAGFLAITGESHRWRWAMLIPATTAAFLIKYAALVMVPFAIVFLWRQKAFQELCWGVLASIALVFGIGWPYLVDWQSFKLDRIQQNAQISHSSLHAFFFHIYKNLISLIPALKPYKEAVRSTLKTILLSIYGCLMLRWGISAIGSGQAIHIQLPKFPQKVALIKPLKQYTADDFLAHSCYAVGFLVYLITFKFYPWYLAMIFPMAMLLPERHWFKRLSVWLTVAHLLSLTFVGQAHVLNYLLMVIVPTILFFVWESKNKKSSLADSASK